MPCIAILDRDEDVRRLIGDALEEQGFRVLLHERIEDLLPLLAARAPHLVIADPWNGRVVHEMEVLRALRRAAAGAGVPILLCSTAADQVPWDGPVLAKPFDLHDLYRAVENALRVPLRKIG